MHFTDSALNELREILRRELGEDVTDAELLECALRIARLIHLIIRNHRKRNRRK